MEIKRENTRAIATLVNRIQSMITGRGIEGVEYPGRIYATVALAEHSLGQDDQAVATVREGIAYITRRAESLADPGDRASYLENIPSHRQLAELAREWDDSAKSDSA